jgi:hypothetical protein
MRLPTSLLMAATILPSLRTAALQHPEDKLWTEYAKKNLDKLISIDKKLNEKLENASLEIDGYLFSRNESSAQRTIEIVREYINHREEFIAQIHVLTQRVPSLANLPFFNEERWTKELNDTKNELSKLERVMKLHQTLLKLNEKNEKVNNLTQQFKVEGKRRFLASAMNLTGELVDEIKSFIHEVSDVRSFTLTHNLTGVITNLWIEQLLDLEYWEYLLRNKTEDLHRLQRTKIPIVVNNYIRPFLFVIIFVVGLAENVALIIIFARYPKIRKSRNMVILNLSVADTLSLIVNLPVKHLYESMSSWDASPPTAQIFMFYRFLCFGLSVFSVVALCLQRFSTTLKLSVHSGFILRQSTKHTSILLIVAVWISAIIFATPHGMYGCIYFKDCFSNNVELYSKIASAIFLTDLIGLSLIPTIAITTLYLFTVFHLILRVQQLPVDMPEHQRTYQSKTLSRSKNVMILTPIVFAITSLPYYIYRAGDSFLGTDINSPSYTIIEGILYCLIFVNCSFNPVALYCTSGTFRHCIKMYFFWWERNRNSYTKEQPTRPVVSHTVKNTADTCL